MTTPTSTLPVAAFPFPLVRCRLTLPPHAAAGCWAASSVSDNIWTHPSSAPQLVITGGTIFNAGAYGGGDCANSDCNGITMNGGSLTMTGVAVRNNQASLNLNP